MQNQGPKDEKNKPITKANHLNLMQNHHGPSHNAHKRRPTEDGRIQAQPWCGRTPPGPFGANLGWLTLTTMPNIGVEVLSKFNVHGGRFGAFHVAIKHIP